MKTIKVILISLCLLVLVSGPVLAYSWQTVCELAEASGWGPPWGLLCGGALFDSALYGPDGWVWL